MTGVWIALLVVLLFLSAVVFFINYSDTQNMISFAMFIILVCISLNNFDYYRVSYNYNKRKKLYNYVVENIDKFEKEEFDIVSCFQTIEHIPDSINLLLGIKTILKKDGYIYFVCHDYCSFINRIMGLKSPIYDIEHLQIYSKKSIRLLFEKAGFHDIELFTIKNIYPLSYWIRLAPIIPAGLKKAVEKLKIAKKFMLGINVGNIGIIAKK